MGRGSRPPRLARQTCRRQALIGRVDHDPTALTDSRGRPGQNPSRHAPASRSHHQPNERRYRRDHRADQSYGRRDDRAYSAGGGNGVCPVSVPDNSCVTAPRSGSRSANVLPPPTSLRSTMSPPCSRRILRLTARPSPVPRDPLCSRTAGISRSASPAARRGRCPSPRSAPICRPARAASSPSPAPRPPPPPPPARCRRCSTAPGGRPPGRPGISARPRPARSSVATPFSLARGPTNSTTSRATAARSVSSRAGSRSLE